jgi:hypothetical protein
MKTDCGNHGGISSRREFLNNFGYGLGGLALASLYGINPSTGEAAPVPSFAPKDPHFPTKAKSIIQLFASGAPSHVDTFDYKPELKAKDGQKHDGGLLFGSPFKFNKYGKSGLEISEVWNELAQNADDMCIINSMFADIPDHGIASKVMNTGSAQLPKPSLGSWVVYGLGTANQNMPGFISLNGSPEWRQAAFLPGIYQGCNITYRRNMRLAELLPNITSEFSTLERQRRQIDLSRHLNEMHMATLSNDIQLKTRIESFETAFKMQTEATDAFDISKEPEHIKEMYGSTTSEEGAKMLIARRLVERGVRFVQINVGGYDHHNDIATALPRTTSRYDKPFAALFKDLKQRGLLDSTLIIWGGEFGRTVTMGGGGGAPGRDHLGRAFSVWMAGGNVKGGIKYGETDELGSRAMKDKVHVHDLHATILHLMGFDHTKLTYTYNGRPFRLTDVYGNVIKEIIS